MKIDLKQKRALVCGSTQGIGKAAATVMAQAGATVTLLARNPQRLEDIRQQLDTSSGQDHRIVTADFSDPCAVSAAAAEELQAVGGFHILVNNTGGPPGGEIASATIDAFENAFTQHLKCNHLLAQAVIPGMKTFEYGRIVNVISTSVKQPLNGLGVSNTIRGAVANWAKTMANELGKFGITVNNVLPGATSTERLSSIVSSKAEKLGIGLSDVEAKMKAEVPAARFADPLEIAYAIAFLASEKASYINGVNLPVDGGRTKCL